MHSLGASSSDIEQTTRTLHSPDGQVSVMCVKVTLTFHQPGDLSRYRPAPGYTLEDTTKALLRGEWPFDYSRPVTPANSIAAITISTSTSRSSSPPVYVDNGSPPAPFAPPDAFHFDQTTPESRRLRRTLKRAIPPLERWYAVTRGMAVGAVQGV